MPASIELALNVLRDASLPVTARQLHGAVAAALETVAGGPGVGHHEQVKPYSAWPLRRSDDDPAGVRLRIAWLRDADLPPALLDRGREWRIGSLVARSFPVGAHVASYEELLSGPPAESVALDVLTPTYFSRSGRPFPLPDPLLIWRSVAARWDAFAGGPVIEQDRWNQVIGAVDVMGATVSTSTALMDRSPRRPGEPPRDSLALGFVGHLEFTLDRSAAAESRQLLGALARFAPFCGIGAMTTRGLGACATTVKEGA